MKEQLEAHLNRHTNLAQIIHILNETLQPLTSISKLPTIPQLCVHAVNINILVFSQRCFFIIKNIFL